MPKLTHIRQGDDLITPRAIVAIDGLGKMVSNYRELPMLFRSTKVEVHSDSNKEKSQPKVIITDELGNVFEPDPVTGVLHRTDGRVTIGKAPEPVKIPTNVERLKSILRYDPNYFIGSDVFKMWDGFGVCHGMIISSQWRKKSHTAAVQQMMTWTVVYGDQDSEDLTTPEMEKWVIDCVDGTTVTIADPLSQLADENPTDQAHIDTNNIGMANEQRPTAVTTPDQTAWDFCGQAEAKAQTNRSNVQEDQLDVDILKLHDDDVYLTTESQTFFHVCRALNLDRSQYKAYYNWVSKHFKMGHKYIAKKAGNTGFNHPWGGRRATMFPVDTKFPLPTGPGWRYVLEQHRLRSNNLNDDHINANLCRAAVEHEADYVRAAMKVLRTTENQTEVIACAVQALASDNTNDYDTRMKPYIDNITGKITAPKHFRNILERPDSALWQKAIKTEWDAIMDMQVLSLGWTKRKLQAAGINKPAVSARVLLDVKYKPCGAMDKYKARLIQQGHPGNCFKGVHYNEVFTATPQMVSTRILQAIRIGLGWHSMPADVKTAFLHADTEEAQQYPIKLPEGLRTYTMEDGVRQEEFAMLHKNLYGSPVSPRLWAACLNKWVKEYFTSAEWTVKQLRADPCMHKITNVKTGTVTFLLTHTDDIDLVCEVADDGVRILDAFDKRFGITMCNPKYMLGVERRVTKDPLTGATHLEMIQPDYISTMYKSWEQYISKRAVHTPVPEGTFLCQRDKFGDIIETSSEEHTAVIERGYQKVCGELLWATRNTYPQCSAGMVQLCSVMSRPTEEAWKAAMHMVSYLNQHQDEGIRFSSDKSPIPTTFYDSSDKGNHDDEKAQYGYCIMMFGGPIAWSSKKHRHVGKSSSHNEYMAMSHAAVETKWVRDLIKEMGFNQWVTEPTALMGDNDQATRWSVENMVTTGNKCIRTEYHWVKESYEEGDISPQRIETARNLSDCMTKALPREVIDRLVGGLTGYEDIPSAPGPAPR
jgi:hypothetical protein